jgi:NAD(P)-dependent dehydrogenase (short-subunit alcohol dehydrogenase family)
LVNNAALINRSAPLWQVPAAEFDRVVDVNVKGVANVIRHFVPAMVAGILYSVFSSIGFALCLIPGLFVVAALQFPALAAESGRLAARLDDAALLRILDGAAQLRLFLDRNVKEDVALEAGCLALARS